MGLCLNYIKAIPLGSRGCSHQAELGKLMMSKAVFGGVCVDGISSFQRSLRFANPHISAGFDQGVCRHHRHLLLPFSAPELERSNLRHPVFAGSLALPLVVGYSTKEQKNTKPTGIITFQWDSCNGETVKLNSGVIVPSVNTIASYEGNDPVEGWYLNAPKIQIRDSDGGYTIRYYCSDAYNNSTRNTEAGWANENGDLDTITELSLGGGAWVSCASADCAFTTSGAIAANETAVGGYSKPTLLCGGAFPISFKINDTDAVTWTLTPGQSYEGENPIEGWYLNAPKIQVRDADGGYTVRYYCSDAYNNDTRKTEAGWANENGDLDTATVVDVGGGFWLSQPNGDRNVYVTVKTPVK